MLFRSYLDEGSLVAVPSFLYEMSDAGLEVIKRTDYSTAIGTLLICRVREAGYVQVAGPVINAEQKMLCEDMLREGCDLVLIDGAIDRKTIASPDTSDAIILATGAVISRKLGKVVEETAHVVNLYMHFAISFSPPALITALYASHRTASRYCLYFA